MIPATASCGTCLAFEFRSVLGAVLYITSHHHPTKFNKIFAKNMRIEFESDVTVIPQVEHELFADGNGFKKDEFAALLKKGISAAQNGERESARNLLMKASEVDPRSGLGLDADPVRRRLGAPGTGYRRWWCGRVLRCP